MQPDRYLAYISIGISLCASFAALAGYLAYSKRRSPLEGLLLGLFLGPIGVIIEWFLPFLHRPIVDENSMNSFRSMMDYQATGREFKSRIDLDEKRQKERESWQSRSKS